MFAGVGPLDHDRSLAKEPRTIKVARRDQLFDHSRVGRYPVGGHLSVPCAVLEDAGEEPAGGRQSRFGEISTSMIWPYWSIARYGYTHRPAPSTC